MPRRAATKRSWRAGLMAPAMNQILMSFANSADLFGWPGPMAAPSDCVKRWSQAQRESKSARRLPSATNQDCAPI